jgi:hypothetical protein
MDGKPNRDVKSQSILAFMNAYPLKNRFLAAAIGIPRRIIIALSAIYVILIR